MRSFEIRRIRSGIEEDFAWVSLWFRTDERGLEPLHSSRQRSDDQASPRSEFDAIYIERPDQAIACYGAAKRVWVGEDRIEVHLNPKGIKALGLDRSFELDAPTGLSGWAKARRVLREMAGYSTGGAIDVA